MKPSAFCAVGILECVLIPKHISCIAPAQDFRSRVFPALRTGIEEVRGISSVGTCSQIFEARRADWNQTGAGVHGPIL